MGRRPRLIDYLEDPDSYPEVDRVGRRAGQRDTPAPVRPQRVPRAPPRRMLRPGEGSNPFPTSIPDPQQPVQHVPFSSVTMPQTQPAPGQDIGGYLSGTQPYASPLAEILAQTDTPMGYVPRFSQPPPDAEVPVRPFLDFNADWRRAHQIGRNKPPKRF